MPRLTAGEPLPLKFYSALGLGCRWPGGKDAYAECWECGGHEKVGIHHESGEYRCNKCGQSGGMKGFLRVVWDLAGRERQDYAELQAQRGLLTSRPLEAWGVRRNPFNGEWLVPGWGTDGRIHALYRYAHAARKPALLALPGSSHFPSGVNLLDPRREEVLLVEGVWNALAVWEVLRYRKDARFNVLSLPGAMTFRPEFSPYLAGKKVTLLFDNDHPTLTKHGAPVLPAAYQGMMKVVQGVPQQDGRPKSIHYVAWGGRFKTHNPELAHGYDVRDWLNQKDTLADRSELLTNLLTLAVPYHKCWLENRAPDPPSPAANGYHVNGNGHGDPGGEGGGSPQGEDGETGEVGEQSLECLPCSSYEDLVGTWQDAMEWHRGLDAGLCVMLATIISTEANGDQLWTMPLSAPSSGKTQLCEAVSVAQKYVFPKSTIRGFHTGFKVDKHGVVDTSLIAKLKNKTLVTKDGDTLLRSPNVEQILSEARDIYDRVSRTDYRHGVSRNYVGHSMTWILCGTSSLRALDSSELGERFLRVTLIDRMDAEMERRIARMKVRQSAFDLKRKSDGKLEHSENAGIVLAKQRTGGFVNHLRENSEGLLEAVEDTDDELDHCQELGEFVSFLRTKPSKTQKEVVERELCFRLVSQLARLSGCLAAVLGRTTRDAEVMRLTHKVAMDTCQGRGLEIAKVLYNAGRRHGASSHTAAVYTCEPESDVRQILQFFAKLGVVEVFTYTSAASPRGKPHYRLTERLHDLYTRIVGRQE